MREMVIPGHKIVHDERLNLHLRNLGKGTVCHSSSSKRATLFNNAERKKFRTTAAQAAQREISSQILELNCIVFGDSPHQVFGVDIAQNEQVSALRMLIKKQKPRSLPDAPDLILFKASGLVPRLDMTT
ncbi:hypothetical protein BD779DRAFT_1693574 [Infundibulicybe gibba]|nr:hypothetical protein BD779DRAFT_1693574 [Infundibulicybe gibba]